MGWTVRLALSAAIVTTVLATCPSFRWKQFRDMCYWRSFYSKITWYDAGQVCRNMSGELASIHDAGLDTFLTKELLKGQAAWVGLRRENSSSDWVWTDGSAYNYSRWFMDYSDCGDRYPCCAAINYGSDGEWTPSDCIDGDIPFLCQMEAS
ncbi:lectin BRA-3-like [Amphibalanus amphitrite]|uniref:lectin BRA-3-like n=1 Tax=Amphibalanus amphitrite TaxID=1232801 RepID=UPI001C917FD2|nr:lectin BRA-3-like [Amphibalanus amphitrite]